jgi:hypothetical protein
MSQRRRDVEVARDRTIAQPFGAEGEDLVTIDVSPRPPEGLTQGSRPLKSRPDTVTDQGPLKLADGGHHVEDELPGGSGGVDVLFDREESNSAETEVFESLDELLDGAGGPVKTLDDDDVELPLGRIGQESAEAYPIVARSRSDVAVGFYQLPTASNGMVPDLGELNLKVLLIGANSEIGGGARDRGSAHVTQPLRFRGFEALPKGANPVGATKLFLLSVSGPGSRNIPMFLEPIGAPSTAW